MVAKQSRIADQETRKLLHLATFSELVRHRARQKRETQVEATDHLILTLKE